MRSAALLLLAALAATVPADSARIPPAAERAIRDISSRELRAHVEALASDAMEGRAVGHQGNRRAVDYIAAALRQADVEPALHSVELYQASLGQNAQLTVGQPGSEPIVRLAAGLRFYPLPQSSPTAVSGRLLFVGHGISAPRHGHDDYARIDARGAIALALDDAPDSLRRRPGLREAQKIELATLDRKIADAEAHGARGLVVIREYPGDARMIWPETPSLRAASYRLHGRIPSVAVAVIAEDAALPIRQALDANANLQATLDPDISVQRLTVHNVLAQMDAAGTTSEVVVVGAHLDHDGIDGAGQVYNGADDNASGTAAVLTIAAAFRRAASAGERPRRRRVVFALWNAEEKGSLGSEAYIDAPPSPARIVANINLDMIGRSGPVHALGYSYSPELGVLVRRANEAVKLKIEPDPDEGAHSLLQRSDNWPFLKRGIPAVFFTTGMHDEYHTPLDDADRLDFAQLERIAELVGRLAWIVAESDAPRFRSR